METKALKRAISLIAVTLMVFATVSVITRNSSADQWDGNPMVVTDKAVYLTGEPVRINVTCYLPGSYSSSGQCFFTVKDSANKTIYDLRNHVYVLWVLTFLLPPKTFSFSWNQKNDSGVQVAPGDYEIWGYQAGYSFWGPPIAGNSTSITITNESVPVPVLNKMEVRLLKGWNLFSLPMIASNYSASSLGLPSGSVIVRWNSTVQSYDHSYVVGVSSPPQDFPLVEGIGYWIYPSSNCTVTVFGAVVNATRHYSWNVPSTGGWVMVGFPKASQIWPARDVSSWTDKPDAVRAVVMWNTGFQTYMTYIPGIDIPPVFFMIPGFGYWVNLSESVAVAYGP